MVLEIKNLVVSLDTFSKRIEILRNVNFSIGKNEVVSLVGESGCGKTFTALSIMKLLPKNAKIEKGEIFIEGENITEKSEKDIAKIRGNKVSMIFQEPSSYLNPVFTIGNQMTECIKEKINKKEKEEKIFKVLKEVNLSEDVFFQYPHQLSGGMQQRVMIGMAIINSPSLLIADEPTTALDVTTAFHIINLLKKLIKTHNISVLFITHDICLAINFSDKIYVMYAGKIVEKASSKKIISSPLHPYTEKLILCLPEKYKKGERIKAIPGNVPDFSSLPSGCAFHPRCPYTKQICKNFSPAEVKIGENYVRCFKYGEIVENN
ncbi:MAG TPA: ABC transporter ATP-binding protein [bacterium]|nr:ABC transporter ATP-binding protein [bacterium]